MARLIQNFLCALCLALAAAIPAFADSKAESLKPAADTAASPAGTGTEAELEAKYRAELEKRLAQEIASHEGSLRSLWIANAAVWACLLAFVVMQALALRKREAELARLRAERKP